MSRMKNSNPKAFGAPSRKVHCADITHCPASHYLTCQAYFEGKLCFEVVGKPCCKRNDPRRCLKCWVFIEYHLRSGLPLPNAGKEEQPR